jgi:shikimate kinase
MRPRRWLASPAAFWHIITMPTTTNLFLVGPMGSGKSTVGKRLAQLLGRTFVDSDKEIERHTGASIPLIFEKDGEGGFRARERAVIEDLTRRRDLVLATGGGVVLDPANRRCLIERGLVVYLRTSVAEQLSRTADDHHRPLLQIADREGRLASLLAAREPLYREVADIVVTTDGHSVRQVIQDILHHLRQLEPLSGGHRLGD